MGARQGALFRGSSAPALIGAAMELFLIVNFFRPGLQPTGHSAIMFHMEQYEPEQDTFVYDEEPEERPRKRIGALGYACLAIALLLIGCGAVAAAFRGMPGVPARMAEALAHKDDPTPELPPETDEPGADTPGVDTPGADTPAVNAPGTDVPGVDTPGTTTVPERDDFERTAILVDGERVGVAASREAAESVVAETLAWFELQILGSGTMVTEMENDIAYETVTDGNPEDDVTRAEELIAYLTGPDTPLTVRTVVTEETVVHTPCESTEEQDKYLLEGTSIIVRYGTDGESHTITTRTYVNGKEQGKGETVTVADREAVDALVRVGTKKIDMDAQPGREEGLRGKKAGDLKFRAPLAKGKISSNYGQREGVLHLGLDYSGEGGEDVLAACGGTVVSAIERGGYGLMVEIDHGDGFVTRYAHLGSIIVGIGDEVETGEPIGTLGSTGNSRTPHLHFELRIDGVAYNPRYYID